MIWWNNFGNDLAASSYLNLVSHRNPVEHFGIVVPQFSNRSSLHVLHNVAHRSFPTKKEFERETGWR
jgi:hypothetical protein